MAFEDVMAQIMQWTPPPKRSPRSARSWPSQQPGRSAPPEIAAALEAVSAAAGSPVWPSCRHRNRRCSSASFVCTCTRPPTCSSTPTVRRGGRSPIPSILDGWGRGSAMVPPLDRGGAPRPRRGHQLPRCRHRRGLARGVRDERVALGHGRRHRPVARRRSSEPGPTSRRPGSTRASRCATRTSPGIDDVDAFDCAWIPTFFLSEGDLEAGLPPPCVRCGRGPGSPSGLMRANPDALAQATAALRTIRGGGIVLHAERASNCWRTPAAMPCIARSPAAPRRSTSCSVNATPPDSPAGTGTTLVRVGGGGRSMGDNDPGVAQEAWRELLDVLRASDRSFIDGDRGCFDEREVGFGYRNLTHIVSFATGMYMNADPEWPMFVTFVEGPSRREESGRASRCPLPVGVRARWPPLSDHRPPGRRGVPVLHAASRCTAARDSSSTSTVTSTTMT